MSDDIVVQIGEAWLTDRISTHYATCWQSHPGCAVRVLLDEIEAQQVEIDRLRGEIGQR
jgi:hypothetical protein